MNLALPTRPLTANVVYLQLRGWSELAPDEQVARRDQLQATVTSMLAAWPDDARLVIEADDAIAIVSPAHARQAERAAEHAAGGAALGVGLHRGPVRLVVDEPQAPRAVGEGLETARRLADGAAEGEVAASPAFRRTLAAPGRRALLGALGVLALVGIGSSVRVVRERQAAARRPGVIVLSIRPAGDVYIDGELKGTAPPLSRLWIAPGPHTVEIRHGRSKPLRMDVVLRAGEELELNHTFDSGPVRRRAWWERFRFW